LIQPYSISFEETTPVTKPPINVMPKIVKMPYIVIPNKPTMKLLNIMEETNKTIIENTRPIGLILSLILLIKFFKLFKSPLKL
jgi:hypothetical protein